MECRCEKDNFDDAVTETKLLRFEDCSLGSVCSKSFIFPGWWPNSNSIQMGAFTVLGYLLYRFSQTLPGLIRWPIRLFCSLTGLTALWGWVSRLVRAIHGIQNVFELVSRLWRFVIAFSSKCRWLVAVVREITGNEALEIETGQICSSSNKPGLRLILLGSTGGRQTSLADSLLGNTDSRAPMGPLKESSKRRTLVDGREVTVIDTPDLLGPSLGNNSRAREALRSLQLASPGPHAFLVVIQVPGSNTINQDAAQAIQATLELFGDGVMGYIIPVLTHVDHLSPTCTVDQLLDVDAGGLKRAVCLCGQRPELVDNRPDRPPEAHSVMRRQLVGRVMEVKKLRGLFVHELQRREDHIREELLADMSSALARKLGHM